MVELRFGKIERTLINTTVLSIFRADKQVGKIVGRTVGPKMRAYRLWLDGRDCGEHFSVARAKQVAREVDALLEKSGADG